MKNQAIILVIEDDDAYALLLRRAFTRAKILNPLRVVISAEEAIAYLKGMDEYQDRAQYPLPSLIVLDLKLPGMSGHEGRNALLPCQPDACRGLPSCMR